MSKIVKLTEKQLSNIVERIMKEDNQRGSFLYSDSVDTELIQEVINRMTKFHTEGKIKGNNEYMEKYHEYVRALKSLNRKFPI